MANNKLIIEGILDTKGIVKGVKGANNALDGINLKAPRKLITNLSDGTQKVIRNIHVLRGAMDSVTQSVRKAKVQQQQFTKKNIQARNILEFAENLNSERIQKNRKKQFSISDKSKDLIRDTQLKPKRRKFATEFSKINERISDNLQKQLVRNFEKNVRLQKKLFNDEDISKAFKRINNFDKNLTQINSKQKSNIAKYLPSLKLSDLNANSTKTLERKITSAIKESTKQREATSKNTAAVKKNTAVARNGGSSRFGGNSSGPRGFGGRGLSIYDTALATLGLGYFTQALITPVAQTEANIDRAIGTRPENTSDPSKSFSEIRANFNQKTADLLSNIRNATLDSTITLNEFSEGVTNIYKDGLTVVKDASKGFASAKSQARTLLGQRLATGAITQKIFDRSLIELGKINSFDTNDYITLATKTASRSARGLSEPENFGKIANVLGDVLPKIIDGPDALSKTLADISSGRIERNFVTAVNSSRFDSLEITNALRNTIGIQSRVKNLDTAEILKLIAVFDRIGPSAIRVGTSLRRFTQELTNTAKVKVFQNAGFSKAEGLNIIKTFKASENAEDFIKNFISVLDEVEKRGKKSPGQFAFKLLGTEGDRPASEIIKDRDAILASFKEINRKANDINLGNQIALVEENLIGSFKKLNTAYQRLLSSIGLDGGIFSGLSKVFDTISSFFNNLTSLFTSIPALGTLVGSFISVGIATFTVVAIIGGLTFAFTRLTAIVGGRLLAKIFGFATAISMLSVSPLGTITGGILTFIATSKSFRKNFLTTKGIRNAIIGVAFLMKTIKGLANISFTGALSVFGAVQFVRNIENIIPGISKFGEQFIGTTTGMIAGFMLAGPLGAVIGGTVGWILSFTSSSEEMSNAIQSLYDKFVSIINAAKSFRTDFRQKRNDFFGYNESETGSIFGIINREALSNKIAMQEKMIQRQKDLIAPGLDNGYNFNDILNKIPFFGDEELLEERRSSQLEELNETLKELVRRLENAGGELR